MNLNRAVSLSKQQLGCVCEEAFKYRGFCYVRIAYELTDKDMDMLNRAFATGFDIHRELAVVEIDDTR